MLPRRLQRIYFETSALNSFKEKFGWEVALNTKAYQNLRGRGYFISPLVIFEVLSTKDANRREELIFFAQHLFEATLLPSPEELIVNFIEGGCKRTEPEYDLVSKGQIADHWRRICADRRKTLLYDEAAIQSRSALLRKLGKLLFDFHSHKDVAVSKNDTLAGANLTVFGLVHSYKLASEADLADPETRQHVGLVTLLIVLILCGVVTVDGSPIQAFWKSRGVEKLEQRIHFTLTNYPQLVTYGPFHLLAAMISVHTDRTFSRGMIFDCFHAIYAVYSDTLLTADAHFTDMRERLGKGAPIYHKIRHVDEIEINWVETNEPPEPKGWLDT